jgi:phospholipid-translocating ATPase
LTPETFITNVYGNNELLFTSAYFWFCMILVVTLSLTPRYLAKAWKFGFNPDDIDTVRWIQKMDPHRDMKLHDDPPTPSPSSPHSRPDSGDLKYHYVKASAKRVGNRTDMATGVQSIHRGFGFSMEENGVALQRMQSHLSEMPEDVGPITPRRKGTKTFRRVFSIRHSLLNRNSSASTRKDS